MKKIKTIPFFFLLFLAKSIAQEGWINLAPNFNDVRIDDVYFINPDTGWLAGTSVIRKTTDGGQTWQTQLTTPGQYLRSIEFLNAKYGFCGTLDGAFYRTTDGGDTWTDISSAIPGNAPGICGLSHRGQNVYGCGIWSFPAYFIKSYDAGDTWSYKDMSEHAVALIEPLFFHSDSGFVAGQDELGGVILFTADGGETWEEVHNTGVSGEYVWKLQMLTRDTLFASVENFGPTGSILVSHNGGKSWFSKPFNFWGNIQAIGFITGSKGWVGGYFDGFHETTDGGDTWTNLGVGNTLNRIFVLSPELAYASGETVYKFIGPPLPSATGEPVAKKELDWAVTTAEQGRHLKVTLNLRQTGAVQLGLYNMEGRLLKMLHNGRLPEGQHQLEHQLDCAAGAYIIGLQLNEGIGVKKIVVH
jgi:photosystem II stability/assembly factor-like uncharacterized protein